MQSACLLPNVAYIYGNCVVRRFCPTLFSQEYQQRRHRSDSVTIYIFVLPASSKIDQCYVYQIMFSVLFSTIIKSRGHQIHQIKLNQTRSAGIRDINVILGVNKLDKARKRK